MPYGLHGDLRGAAGGVVFALQGFEQAVQLAGEARNPKKDLSRAIITAMAIGAVLYPLLQVVFIAGVDPATSANDWATRSAATRRTTAPGTPSRSRSAPAGWRRS